MARPLRIEFAGALYHVTNRGDRRERIWEDDADRKAFLKVLEDVVGRFHWLCHAYCLMDNHYHLLVETPEPNLARGMRHLNGVYTQRYNARHGAAGHVFQGRYKAVIVEKESHVIEVSRYVVLNPVRAGIVKRPEQWRWSSYGATGGLCKAPAVLQTDWLMMQFGSKRNEAQRAYRQFVRDGLEGPSPWRGLVGGILLGGEEFVARCRALIGPQKPFHDIPRTERYAGRPTLKDLFGGVAHRERGKRNTCIAHAYIEYGYTMTQIGDFLGLHYSTVSVIIHRVEQGT